MVLFRLALVLDIETLTETIFHAQRKGRFVLGVRGGHVARTTDRATLNDLVEDLLKKSAAPLEGASRRTISRGSNRIVR